MANVVFLLVGIEMIEKRALDKNGSSSVWVSCSNYSKTIASQTGITMLQQKGIKNKKRAVFMINRNNSNRGRERGKAILWANVHNENLFATSSAWPRLGEWMDKRMSNAFF